MATKTFTGTLSQAMDSLAAEGNKIIFVPQQTVGDVLTGASSIMTVDSDGSYSVKLSYNTYSIYHYSDVSKRKIKIGDNIVVASDTTAGTLSDLITSATGELTSDEVLAIQGYLEDAEDYATAAAASYTSTSALFDDFDDNVLDVVGEIHTDTPALSAPFNESGKLDYGYGTEYVSGLPVYSVDFSRSTTSAVINKSGELETLASDEMGIGADGVWLHGSYSVLNNYSFSPDQWTATGATVTESGVFWGDYEAYEFTGVDGSATNIYDTAMSCTSGEGYISSLAISKESGCDSVQVNFRNNNSAGFQSMVIDFEGNQVGSKSAYVELINFTDLGDVVIASFSSECDQDSTNFTVKVSPYDSASLSASVEGPLVIFGMWTYASEMELPPLITNGSTVSATATSCTAPVNGNLPATGESFTIVCDSYVDGSSDEANYRSYWSIGDSTNYIGLDQSSNGGLRVQNSMGEWIGTTAASTGTISRLSVVYDVTDSSSSTVAIYQDGDLLSTSSFDSVLGDISSGTVNLGVTRIGGNILNSQIKNFRIYHYAADAAEVASWGGAK